MSIRSKARRPQAPKGDRWLAMKEKRAQHMLEQDILLGRVDPRTKFTLRQGYFKADD